MKLIEQSVTDGKIAPQLLYHVINVKSVHNLTKKHC